MVPPKDKDQYSAKEARQRFENALLGGFKTPAKPHSEMKLGKRKPRKTSTAKNTRSRG
jgi:hypothetical protein